MTSDLPGVYANLANEEIFTFVQKWRSIHSLFTSERSDDEWKDLLKTMTNLDPVNGDGVRLSEFLSTTNPNISQLIMNTNCDLNGTSRKLYEGRCICKTGYFGRFCTACDRRIITNCNEGHFVLITSGYGLYINGRKTELLNLKNHKFTCPGPPDYPMQMTHGAGGMIGNVPLICGGQKGDFLQRFGDCYTLKGQQWIKNGSLDQPRSRMGTGTIDMNNALFINGGVLDGSHYGNWYISKSNEKIVLNSKSKLPDLPKSRYDHCNIPINETHFIITGGIVDGRYYTTKTLVFDVNTKTFSQGPRLNQARKAHGCFNAKIGNRQVMFVTGGNYGGNNGELNTIEFLDLSQPELGWSYGNISLIQSLSHFKPNRNFVAGQNLPLKVWDHRMVQTPDTNSVYLTGGYDPSSWGNEYSNKILEMKCPNQTPESCFFNEIPTKMKYPRDAHIALSITTELAKELCQ